MAHCPNRSPNVTPRKEQSAQKEHTVAWDLNGAQSAHPMILPIGVSTEAEAPDVQFNPMNMPKINKYPPVIHLQPDRDFFKALKKSPKRNPRGKEKTAEGRGSAERQLVRFRPRPVDRIRLDSRSPEGKRLSGLADPPLQTNLSESGTLPRKRSAYFEVDSPAMKLAGQKSPPTRGVDV